MRVKRLVNQGDEIFVVVFGEPVRYRVGDFLVKNFSVSMNVFERPPTNPSP